MQFDVHQGGIQKHATDVLEHHIDTVWSRSGQRGRELAGRFPPIVDRRIESVAFDQTFAFGRPTGASDRTAALDFPYLPPKRTPRPSRTVDEHRFAAPWPAHVHDAEVGSDSRSTQHR